eukprot:1065998-Amorphochlora_amoeboformis.AAC.2
MRRDPSLFVQQCTQNSLQGGAGDAQARGRKRPDGRSVSEGDRREKFQSHPLLPRADRGAAPDTRLLWSLSEASGKLRVAVDGYIQPHSTVSSRQALSVTCGRTDRYSASPLPSQDHYRLPLARTE